jgi:chemotaxis protein CheD
MTTAEVLTAPTIVTVGLGQIAVAQDVGSLTSVLGSCIGLTVYAPRLKLGLMAHIVLPDSAGRAAQPGKFADTAIPEVVRLLREAGGSIHGASFKLTGGASMFGKAGPLQVGQANLDAVLRALAEADCSVAARHVGGNKGRRITLDCATGHLRLEIVGQSPILL